MRVTIGTRRCEITSSSLRYDRTFICGVISVVHHGNKRAKNIKGLSAWQKYISIWELGAEHGLGPQEEPRADLRPPTKWSPPHPLQFRWWNAEKRRRSARNATKRWFLQLSCNFVTGTGPAPERLRSLQCRNTKWNLRKRKKWSGSNCRKVLPTIPINCNSA